MRATLDQYLRCHRIRRSIAAQIVSIRPTRSFSANNRSQMERVSSKENSRPNNTRIQRLHPDKYQLNVRYGRELTSGISEAKPPLFASARPIPSQPLSKHLDEYGYCARLWEEHHDCWKEGSYRHVHRMIWPSA